MINSWYDVVSIFLNLVLGSGVIVSLVTLRAQRKKVLTEVDSNEIQNVDRAVTIWRKLAEDIDVRYNDLNDTYNKVTAQMATMENKMVEMEGTIRQLTQTNRQIIKILNSINHDNLEQKKQEAKEITV